MPFHTAAYHESIDSTTLVSVDAVQDGILAERDDKFVMRRDTSLRYACAVGADIAQALIDAPTFKQEFDPNLPHLNGAATLPNPVRLNVFEEGLFDLPKNENLDFQAANASAGANDISFITGLMFDKRPAPAGMPLWFRGTSTATSVVDTWTQIDMTWQQNLPNGVYSVIGGYAIAATTLGFRLIVEGHDYYPGGLVYPAATSWFHPLFQNGGLGEWITFESQYPPNIQVLSQSAVSVFTVYLQLVKIR
ncbi:MAG: hypothetical protein MJA83_12260 [Gammaproteobacteria bacterium]|nr:hypothetical protein [Gammaproteobacteria bacterium]